MICLQASDIPTWQVPSALLVLLAAVSLQKANKMIDTQFTIASYLSISFYISISHYYLYWKKKKKKKEDNNNNYNI